MGFFLRSTNLFADWSLNCKMVKVADALGYSGILITDHYMFGPDDPANINLEAWLALTWLASVTKRLRIGTMVTPITLRPPTILAKMISTLDNLSNGRVIVGVGAGWVEPEFRVYSSWEPARARVRKVEEALKLMLRLWTDTKVTFHGNYYRIADAILEPKPIQKPHPPLLFGGAGERMITLAGMYADMFFPMSACSTTRYRAIRRKVIEAAKEVGREDCISFVYDLQEHAGLQSYSTSKWIDTVNFARRLGATHFTVSFAFSEDPLKTMKQFASEVVAKHI